MFLEPLAKLIADDAFDDGAHLRRHQLVLGLGGKLGVRHLHREDTGQTFPRVITRKRHLFLLGDAGLGSKGVDGAGQRPAEPGKMGAAITLGDVVGEAQHGLVIAVGPL